MSTSILSVTDTIREFLALPAEAMPRALWLDGMDDSGTPWPHLKDYVRPENRQRINHLGETVRLSADRDGWRDGVTVALS